MTRDRMVTARTHGLTSMVYTAVRRVWIIPNNTRPGDPE